MNTRPIEQAKDSLLRDSRAAMQRAALRARVIARQTGTHIVIVRDGMVVHIDPESGVEVARRIDS